MKLRIGAAVLRLAAALLTSASAISSAQSPEVKTVVAAAETQPTQEGGANRAVVAAISGNERIAGTAELGGLEIYSLTGRRLGKVAAGEAAGIDIRESFSIGGRLSSVLVAADATTNSLRFFSTASGQMQEVSARSIPLGFAVENVCLFRSAMDGGMYAFAVGDGGEIDQWMLFTNEKGQVDARQVRRIHVPSTAEHCVADDRSGQLYVSEQAVGLWRFNADAETDSAPILVDAPRLGRISEEVGGVALYDGGDGARWLIASNASAGQLNIYDREKGDAFVGALSVTSPSGVAIGEPGGLYSSRNVAGLPGGVLLVADEDAAGGSNYKIVSFDRLATALGLATGSPQSGVQPAAPFPTIRSRFETQPVPSSGDAADDPAIWANASDPSQSLIVGTDKKSGLHLYDMQGKHCSAPACR